MKNGEMRKKEPINMVSLLISLFALVLGILLLFNGEDTFFNLIRYVISGILLISGIIKLASYMFQRKKYDAPITDCMSSIFLIALAIFVFAFGNAIKLTIQIVVGALVLFNGINRLILGLAIRTVDSEGSKVFTGVSILMIVLGILILTGKFFNLIGIFLIVYAISEIAGYIYYTSQKKDYSAVFNKEVPKEVKEKEAKEAIVEEVQDAVIDEK